LPKPIALSFRSWVGIVAVIATSSCRSPEPTRIGSTVEAGAPSEAVLALVEAAAPPLAPDLDVHALERQLHCPDRRHGHACRILREFARATKGMAQAPSGQGRFVGTAYRVDKGIERNDLVVLLAENVPASGVGPSDIPLRIAMSPLPKDKRRDGNKLARALANGYLPSTTNNKALSFAKTWTSDNGRIAMVTTGPSVRLIAEEATYVRQSGQRALVIKMKPAIPGVLSPPGDGTYAELWAVTW
jgi:hypothetical protein